MNSSEIGELRANPSNTVNPLTDYSDGDGSTFGRPNTEAGVPQDLSGLRYPYQQLDVDCSGDTDVVGEIGFAAGGPRSHSITADTVSEIFELEWESFQRMAVAHPALGVRFLSDVVRIVAARSRAAER